MLGLKGRYRLFPRTRKSLSLKSTRLLRQLHLGEFESRQFPYVLKVDTDKHDYYYTGGVCADKFESN